MFFNPVSAPSIEHKYYDRGDPAGNDFIKTAFTTDDTWRDLDLSAIVSAGAVAVKLIIKVNSDNNGGYLTFRKKGNSNNYNSPRCNTPVVTKNFTYDLFVSCNVNRVIQYRASAITWAFIDVVIGGWIK